MSMWEEFNLLFPFFIKISDNLKKKQDFFLALTLNNITLFRNPISEG
jgi:hypothetical protein